MYKLINLHGEKVGVVSDLIYIRQTPDTAFVFCSEQEAQGVMCGSVPYTLYGRKKMELTEEVTLSYITEQEAKEEDRRIFEQAHTENYLDIVQAQQDITDIQLQLIGGNL